MSDGMKWKLVPQRIVQLMSLVVTQVTTEHEDLTRVEIYFDDKKEIIPSYPSNNINAH